ncbi:MAG: radical SAM family heme chaperone HemW [Alphaproteobacteria bacterium]|nr:radical SAM family heme chaperone HemW [Alphaproteobacteria bacterium]MBN2675466.1 radical SAM family heme chaperone HemW [Alphaproteobacteria bacterium]
MIRMLRPHNFYFHVPFCAAKCKYCAFYSHACQKPDWDGYCEGILKEINFWYYKLGKISVPTIFFGGGTPSLMPTHVLNKIIKSVSEKFLITDDCEISLESNPGTIDEIKLAEFKSIGMNRLSVGVQSLDDEQLQFMGRIHNADQALKLLESAQDLGLRVSADFIYGLPNQSVLNTENLCKKINNLGLKHCSMYELSIEPGTPFEKMNLILPDNETMADIYGMIGKTLNLPRYEVSNYAAPGEECEHNQNIWNGEPYIGFGRGAAGRVLIDDKWYEQLGDGQRFELITTKERATEKILTGMRTIIGVNITPDINKIINFDFIKNNPDLVLIKSNRILTTEKGMLILDDLLINLIKL